MTTTITIAANLATISHALDCATDNHILLELADLVDCARQGDDAMLLLCARNLVDFIEAEMSDPGFIASFDGLAIDLLTPDEVLPAWEELERRKALDWAEWKQERRAVV